MKCIVCGTQIEITNKLDSNIFICPSCGSLSDSNGNKKENIGIFLSDISDKYGVEVFEDFFRLNSLLMDYAPLLEKERKLIISVLREGVLKQLIKIKDDENSQDQIINRCIYQITNDLWINKNAAQYAVYAICNAIGINLNIDSIEEEQTSEDKNENTLIKGSFDTNDDIESLISKYTVIGYKAFAAFENIDRVVVSENITEIKSKAFLNCINLKEVIIKSSSILLAHDAFDGCCSLEKIDVTKTNRFSVVNNILIDKVDRVAIKAELTSSKDEYVVPNGIKIISSRCFERTTVKKIVISENVENIDIDAFCINRFLESIDVDSKNNIYRSIGGVVHSRNMDSLIKYPSGNKSINYYLEDRVKSIGKKAFSGAEHLTEITFTNDLEFIEERAFEYCINLEKIVLPANVKIIGERAFQYCDNLKNVMLSRGINELKDCAFLGCESLETISIPQMVSKIGNYAFAGCKNLKTVIIQNNVTEMGDGVFSECPNVVIKVRGNEFIERYCYSRGLNYEKI